MNLNDKLLVAFGTIGIFCSALLIGPLLVVLAISYGFSGKVSPEFTTLFIAIVGANLLFAAAIMFGARNSGRGS
jgi:hypothetical protein